MRGTQNDTRLLFTIEGQSIKRRRSPCRRGDDEKASPLKLAREVTSGLSVLPSIAEPFSVAAQVPSLASKTQV